MVTRLPTHFLDLVYDALLKSFWYKKTLRSFLRRSGIPTSLLGDLSEDESKRDWLDRIFPKLEDSEQGQVIIQQMAHALADQKSFPDLARHEDAVQMTKQAQEAVATLGKYLAEKRAEQINEQERNVCEGSPKKPRLETFNHKPTLPDYENGWTKIFVRNWGHETAATHFRSGSTT